MSFAIAVNKDKKIIDIQYEGEISFAVWLQVHKEITELHEGLMLREARYIIADFTNATLISFSNEDVSKKSVELVMKTTTYNSNLTIITIAPKALEYGLIRMLQGNIEDISPWESYIVKSRAECQELLKTLDC